MACARLCLLVALAVVAAPAGEAASRPPDRTPPTGPTVDVSTKTLRPVFHFGARDDRTAPMAISFRCAVDGPPLHPCARIYQPASNLAFGQHVIIVKAIDRAGNVSRATRATFTIVGRWDAGTEFQLAPRPANPSPDRYGNTAWFYLSSTTPTHDPAYYEPLDDFAVVNDNWQRWDSSVLGGVLSVGVLVHGREIVLSPIPERNAILGWRSPYSGSVSVDAHVDLPDTRSGGITWSLDVNGSSIKQGELSGGNQTNASVALTINAGDTIYLVIDAGSDSLYDSVGADFRIHTVS